MEFLAEGTEMLNVFNTSIDPVRLFAKDSIHGNLKKCQFCLDKDYSGLLHVAKLSEVQKGDGRSHLHVYLVPGCQSCNKRYHSKLVLKKDVKNVSISDVRAQVVRFPVLRQ